MVLHNLSTILHSLWKWIIFACFVTKRIECQVLIGELFSIYVQYTFKVNNHKENNLCYGPNCTKKNSWHVISFDRKISAENVYLCEMSRMILVNFLAWTNISYSYWQITEEITYLLRLQFHGEKRKEYENISF